MLQQTESLCYNEGNDGTLAWILDYFHGILKAILQGCKAAAWQHTNMKKKLLARLWGFPMLALERK